MKLIIKLFGILLLLSGILLLIKPEFVFGWIENNVENTSLYLIAILVRLVFGVLFIVAARESKYPRVIKFLGYLFVLAALTLIFVGQENFQNFIISLFPHVTPYAPLAGLLSIVFGGLIIYSFSKNKELELK